MSDAREVRAGRPPSPVAGRPGPSAPPGAPPAAAAAPAAVAVVAREAAEAVTVIVPALDEGPRLKQTIDEVRRALAGREHAILVVDDGSSDGSAGGLEADDVRVLRNPVPMGYGHAVKTGARAARTPLVAIIDADGTYAADDLVRLLHEAPGFEMVVGVRALDHSNAPALRRIVKRALFRLAEYVAETRIPDLNSGLRVIRRDAILRHERLLPHGFSLTTSITLAILAEGAPVRYLPIRYLAREGESKIQPLRDTLRFGGYILRLGCLVKPLRIFVPIGVALLAAAAVRLAYDVFVLKDLGDSAPLFVTSGLEVTLMGLLAELVVRTRK